MKRNVVMFFNGKKDFVMETVCIRKTANLAKEFTRRYYESLNYDAEDIKEKVESPITVNFIKDRMYFATEEVNILPSGIRYYTYKSHNSLMVIPEGEMEKSIKYI